MGKIVKNGVTYSASSDSAQNIKYTNTTSGLDASNIQDAIDYLAEHGGGGNANFFDGTEEEVEEAISAGTITEGMHVVITDDESDEDFNASAISYDGTTSGLNASNVQDAIDEVDATVDALNQNLTNKADREAYKNDSTSEYGVRLDTESADGSVVERIQTHKDSTDGSMNIGAYNINSDNTVRDRVQLSYNGTDFIARGQLNNSSVSSKTLITTSYTQMSGHTMGTNCQAATNAVYKVGNLVIFNFVVKATGAVASGATIITLPSGFRPISGFSVGVGKANHGDSGDNNYLNIKTDGTIVTPIALKSGEYVDINCVFIAS